MTDTLLYRLVICLQITGAHLTFGLQEIAL